MSLVDRFIEFEYKNKLFEQKIQRIKYWHYIRLYICLEEILMGIEGVGRTQTVSQECNWVKKIISIFRKIPNYVFRNPLWNIKKQDIICLNTNNRVKCGEYYDCIYTDELIDNLPYSYYVYEQANRYISKKPIRTKNLKNFDYIDFKQSIKVRFYKLFNLYKINSEEMLQIKDLIIKIKDEFLIEVDIHRMLGRIQNIIWSHKAYSKCYSKILDKVKPKIIIEVSSYEFNRYLINELAKERGIMTIELQHGTMGKNALEYNFYTEYNLSTFPDKMFLFGEYWKRNTRLPIDKNNILVTGFPYFEKYSGQISKGPKPEKENILFISQGPIGKELSKLAVELNQLIDHNTYQIIYKLHPGEYSYWEREYPWLKNSSIEVVSNNDRNIYYYLQMARYLVAVYSMTVFEALAFRVKIFIYDSYGKEFTEDLYKSGYAQLIQSAGEILKNLFYNEVDYNKLKHEFWESNSLRNIKENTEKFIKRKQIDNVI